MGHVRGHPQGDPAEIFGKSLTRGEIRPISPSSQDELGFDCVLL